MFSSISLFSFCLCFFFFFVLLRRRVCIGGPMSFSRKRDLSHRDLAEMRYWIEILGLVHFSLLA